MATNYPRMNPVYLAPPAPRMRKSLILNLSFLALGTITVCNLNAVANNIFDLPNFLSPLIVVAGLVGAIAVPGPRFFRLSKAARINMGMLLLLMLVGWIGLVAKMDLMFWASETYRLAASIFVFATAALICGRVAKTYGIKWLLYSSFLIFGASTASVFLGVLFPEWNIRMSNAALDSRASGFFANPNEAGTQACLFITIGFTLTALSSRSRWLIISMAIAVPAVFFTFSRGSIIALFMLSTVLSFFVFPVKNIFRVMLVMLCLIAALFATKQLIQSRMQSEKKGSSLERRLLLFTDLLQGRIDSKTTNGRSQLAKEAYYEWLKSPVYGQGTGGLNNMPQSRLGPHNLFLKILGETGVIGFSFFMFGLATMLYRGLQHRTRFCKVIILGSVLSLMLDGMTSHSGLVHRNFMFALGLAMGVDYFVTESNKRGQRIVV